MSSNTNVKLNFFQTDATSFRPISYLHNVSNQKHLFFMDTQKLLILFALATIGELIFQARTKIRFITCCIFIVLAFALYVLNELFLSINFEPFIFTSIGIYLLYIVWNGCFFFEQFNSQHSTYISTSYGMIIFIFLCTGIPQSILVALSVGVLIEIFIKEFLRVRFSMVLIDVFICIFYILIGTIHYYAFFSIGLEICRTRNTPLRALQCISPYLESIEKKSLNLLQLLASLKENPKLLDDICIFLEQFKISANADFELILNSSNSVENRNPKSFYISLNQPLSCSCTSEVLYKSNPSNLSNFLLNNNKNSEVPDSFQMACESVFLSDNLEEKTHKSSLQNIFKKSFSKVIKSCKKTSSKKKSEQCPNNDEIVTDFRRRLPFLQDDDETSIITDTSEDIREFEKSILFRYRNSQPNLKETVNRLSQMLNDQQLRKKPLKTMAKMSNIYDPKPKVESNENIRLRFDLEETDTKLLKIQNKLKMHSFLLKSLQNPMIDEINIVLPQKKNNGRHMLTALKSRYTCYKIWLESIKAIMVDAQWINPPPSPQSNLWGCLLDKNLEAWRSVWTSKTAAKQVVSLFKLNAICTMFSIALVWITLMAVILKNVPTNHKNKGITLMLLYLSIRTLIHMGTLGFVLSLNHFQLSPEAWGESHYIHRKITLLGVVSLILTELDHFVPICIIGKTFSIIPVYGFSNAAFPIFTQLPCFTNFVIAIILCLIKVCFLIIIRQIGLHFTLTFVSIMISQIAWFLFISKSIAINYRHIFCRYVLPYLIFLNVLQLPDETAFKLKNIVERK